MTTMSLPAASQPRHAEIHTILLFLVVILMSGVIAAIRLSVMTEPTPGEMREAFFFPWVVGLMIFTLSACLTLRTQSKEGTTRVGPMMRLQDWRSLGVWAVTTCAVMSVASLVFF